MDEHNRQQTTVDLGGPAKIRPLSEIPAEWRTDPKRTYEEDCAYRADIFGECPLCDGRRVARVGPPHFSYCLEHKLLWHAGHDEFVSWQEISHEDFAADMAILGAGFMEVAPRWDRRDPLQKIEDLPRNKQLYDMEKAARDKELFSSEEDQG